MRPHLTTAILLVAGLVPAQEETPLEGHSNHGEEFNEGPRQRAYLIDGAKTVHFEVTTRSDEAQDFFDQGVTQLHGFWYFEAERSFRQVAMIDPDCAMAYWGMAMANFTNPDRARGFAWQGYRRRSGVSRRERMYVDGMARYFGVDVAPSSEDPTEPSKKKPLGDEKRRRQKFVEDLEEIIFDFPDDIEAKAFLVNQTWLNQRAGLTIQSRQANQALLDQVFAQNPMHPAHHYRIHLWDLRRTAPRVVDSATRSGASAPGIAHMWHMQGHIWARLDRHAEAAWSQEASARVDHAHMMRDQILPDQIHNFAHNNEWLTRSLRNVGRAHDAIDLARNMIELPRHPLYNLPQKGGCSASYGRRRLLETLRMYELWDELIEVCGSNYLEPTGELEDESRRAFLLGLAQLSKRNLAAGEHQIERLRQVLDDARRERADAVDLAEDEALEAGKAREDVQKAMSAAIDAHAGTLRDIRQNVEWLEALAAFVGAGQKADRDAAIARLEKARFDPVHLARICVEAGDFTKAEKLAEQASRRKGIAVPLATLAWVRHSSGDDDGARDAFAELREFSARFDLDVAPFRRLRPIADALGLPADWRVEEDLPEELVSKADLDSLGPFRWSPPPAPSFELPDGFGGRVSLDEYRGKPTLLIFFLGFGCVHCVEQLHAFEPFAGKFADAGISMLTVGTDTEEQLLESQRGDNESTRYPFPILADPVGRVFKMYRSFDDFENMALHGTFLIDGDGLVRWVDISYEPFMQPEFLLAESIRLLGLPAPAAPHGGGGHGGGGQGGGR